LEIKEKCRPEITQLSEHETWRMVSLMETRNEKIKV
jgi:hypothetical protein